MAELTDDEAAAHMEVLLTPLENGSRVRWYDKQRARYHFGTVLPGGTAAPAGQVYVKWDRYSDGNVIVAKGSSYIETQHLDKLPGGMAHGQAYE